MRKDSLRNEKSKEKESLRNEKPMEDPKYGEEEMRRR
jgi:hypothetical protein